MLKNKKALLSFLVLIIGLVVALILIRFPQLLNSQASSNNIRIKNSSGQELPKEGNIPVTNSQNIKIELVPPDP